MLFNDKVRTVLGIIHNMTMYTDFMTVYRQTETTLENGSTGYTKKKIYSRVPCLLSTAIPDRSETYYVYANPYGILFKIFCSTNLDIRKGDYISCMRKVGDKVGYFQGISNEPIKFIDGHQELYLLDTTEGDSKSFTGIITENDDDVNTEPENPENPEVPEEPEEPSQPDIPVIPEPHNFNKIFRNRSR